MQIDYHHAATYVCCRLAGMAAADAAIVAHASQYVDDATHDGPLSFATGERYVRVTSAHRTLDIRWNADRNDNRLVWVPFHFLPGNDTSGPPSSNPLDAFAKRMICRPNSVIAQELVFDCIGKQDLPFSLHRLGIALHTYVDTWAHQGFVGMVEDFNRIDKIRITPDEAYRRHPVFEDLTSGATAAKAFVSNLLPVGHAAALTLPDLPFLKWSFRRENGETVARDNPAAYLDAATHMFNMVRRYLARNIELPPIDLPEPDRSVIERLTRTTLAIEGEDRHPVWLSEIARRLLFRRRAARLHRNRPGLLEVHCARCRSRRRRRLRTVRVLTAFPHFQLEALSRCRAVPAAFCAASLAAAARDCGVLSGKRSGRLRGISNLP